MRYFKWGLMCLLFALLAGLACRVTRVCGDPDKEDGETDEATIKRHVYESVSKDEDKRFVRKQPPKRGDWLFSYPEKPQPFEIYLAGARVRPTPTRRTIVLQPLGEMDAEQTRMLEDLRDYAEAFFQLPARIEKPIELKLDKPGKDLTRKVPLGLRGTGHEVQYNADVILDSLLIKRVPADAVACLGITMQDLYSGELNYVFGLGSMEQRVGVYSLCRYFPEFWNEKRKPGAEKQALMRALKVLNHETGHMFGLTHCVFYNCSMNGSMSLQETDRAPVHFCPVCDRKLAWNIGYISEKRYADLAAFYAKHEMMDEAEFMKGSVELLHKAAVVDKARRVNDE